MKFATLTGQTLEDVEADRFYPLPLVYQIEGTWLGIRVGSSLGWVRRGGADLWWALEKELFRQFVKISNIGSEEAAIESRGATPTGFSISPLPLREASEALGKSPKLNIAAGALPGRLALTYGENAQLHPMVICRRDIVEDQGSERHLLFGSRGLIQFQREDFLVLNKVPGWLQKFCHFGPAR